MRFLLYLFAGILFPVIVMAQNGTVTGKVTSADIQIPLGNASVFLSNATFGTATASDGTFKLQNVKPGQYELVVTYVGYDTYYQTIMVTGTTLQLNIECTLKIMR